MNRFRFKPKSDRCKTLDTTNLKASTLGKFNGWLLPAIYGRSLQPTIHLALDLTNPKHRCCPDMVQLSVIEQHSWTCTRCPRNPRPSWPRHHQDQASQTEWLKDVLWKTKLDHQCRCTSSHTYTTMSYIVGSLASSPVHPRPLPIASSTTAVSRSNILPKDHRRTAATSHQPIIIHCPMLAQNHTAPKMVYNGHCSRYVEVHELQIRRRYR